MNIFRSESGTAILESLILIPLLLLMLVGITVTADQLSILSVAESASHTEALRSARGQFSTAECWNRPSDSSSPTFRFDSSTGSSRILPSPIPSLAGRTSLTVNAVRKYDQQMQSWLRFASIKANRRAELTGDCWGTGSASGRKITGAIRIAVAAGTVR